MRALLTKLRELLEREAYDHAENMVISCLDPDVRYNLLTERIRAALAKECGSERRYGDWAGDLKGQSEDPKRCIEEVFATMVWSAGHQCSRPRGHGKDGLYCRQHAKRHQDEEQK